MKSRRSSNLSRRFLFCSVITAVIALSNVAVYAQAQAQESKPEAEQTAQIQPGTSRPKIGVALEGGGALGLAHIGVLQWSEDHHIPIDYLAGTSMGGLYATGKSPEELREIVAAQKWDIIIGGDIPYQDLFIRSVSAQTRKTAIGPLFIGGSVGGTGHAKWFFELGHVF